MGNYQEHLKRISPLREVDTGAVRTQLFGNPYRLEKNDTKVSLPASVRGYCGMGEGHSKTGTL